MYHIYCIKNSINDKLYIGQTTKSLEKRFSRHCRAKNTVISQAINKHGSSNFQIVSLYSSDKLSREDLNKLEETFITAFESVSPNGYNLTCIPSSPTSVKNYDRKEELIEVYEQIKNWDNLSFETKEQIVQKII